MQCLDYLFEENIEQADEALWLLSGVVVEATEILPRLKKRSAAVGPIANGNLYKIWPLDTYRLYKAGLRDKVKMCVCVVLLLSCTLYYTLT